MACPFEFIKLDPEVVQSELSIILVSEAFLWGPSCQHGMKHKTTSDGCRVEAWNNDGCIEQDCSGAKLERGFRALIRFVRICSNSNGEVEDNLPIIVMCNATKFLYQDLVRNENMVQAFTQFHLWFIFILSPRAHFFNSQPNLTRDIQILRQGP
ncbi:hypothetical protein FCM35_KLT10453 [Carex littledalei]|uniref:Uncharacterized protein n=1 Tax=Carex littledalei TaxID=544730 RepID=A0A833QTK3_9POAL|nr:hypothetical protein FCM35_KLT10453 [Carex littledalei]